MGTRRIIRFLVLFGVFFGAGHLFLSTSISETLVVTPWIEANMRTATVLAVPVGLDAEVDDNRNLVEARGALHIAKGCDGLGALLIVVSAILGFPAGWRSKLTGVAIGTVGVFLINAVRLASLLWIAVERPAQLEFFHIDFWQPVMMVVSFGLFVVWSVLLPGKPKNKTLREST